jgi:beta-lactamase regulating signal transducer with metallopeptidase domain
VGIAMMSARLTVGFLGAERARRRGILAAPPWVAAAVARLVRKLEIRGIVRVAQSALVEVPTLVGWLKPVILLPVSAVGGLTPGELESILAHELAHIRRHDYLVNLLQAVLETILFYHPAVWWLSRRIRQEREHCCDDIAVSVCGDRIAFARALSTMEELRASPRWAVSARGGSLIERIRRLVSQPQPAGSSHLPALAIAALLIVAAFSVTQRRTTVVAEDQPPVVTAAAAEKELGALLAAPAVAQPIPRPSKTNLERSAADRDDNHFIR